MATCSDEAFCRLAMRSGNLTPTQVVLLLQEAGKAKAANLSFSVADAAVARCLVPPEQGARIVAAAAFEGLGDAEAFCAALALAKGWAARPQLEGASIRWKFDPGRDAAVSARVGESLIVCGLLTRVQVDQLLREVALPTVVATPLAPLPPAPMQPAAPRPGVFDQETVTIRPTPGVDPPPWRPPPPPAPRAAAPARSPTPPPPSRPPGRHPTPRPMQSPPTHRRSSRLADNGAQIGAIVFGVVACVVGLLFATRGSDTPAPPSAPPKVASMPSQPPPTPPPVRQPDPVPPTPEPVRRPPPTPHPQPPPARVPEPSPLLPVLQRVVEAEDAGHRDAAASDIDAALATSGLAEKCQKALRQEKDRIASEEARLAQARGSEARGELRLARQGFVSALDPGPWITAVLWAGNPAAVPADGAARARCLQARFDWLAHEGSKAHGDLRLVEALTCFDLALKVHSMGGLASDDSAVQDSRDALAARIAALPRDAWSAEAGSTPGEDSGRGPAAPPTRSPADADLAGDAFRYNMDEGARLEGAGDLEGALGKYEAALRLKADPEARKARDRVAGRLFATKVEFIPGAAEVPADGQACLIELSDLMLQMWVGRDQPQQHVEEFRSAVGRIDLAVKRLPKETALKPSFAFVQGVGHFMLARGIFDEFMEQKLRTPNKIEKKKVMDKYEPIYKKELTAAQDGLKKARKGLPDSFAVIMFEDLSRVWSTDEWTTKPADEAIRKDLGAHRPLTKFEQELDVYCAGPGLPKRN